MRKVTRSEKETHDFAASWAKKLKGGEVLALSGDLGAGKTAFTKGLAAGLGITKAITSPTFVLMKVYPVTLTGAQSAIKHLVHVDAYRVIHSNALVGIGLEDYLNSSEAVVIIEWAERVLEMLGRSTTFFTFTHRDGKENSRIIEINSSARKQSCVINN